MADFKKKGDFKLKQSLKNYERFKTVIPILLANEAENHFKKGFTKGGGQTNLSKTGWKERQFTKGKGKRNILVGRGTLQRDIQKRRISFNTIVIGTSSLTSKYADIHNKGGKIRITERMRKFFWAQSKNASTKSEQEYWKNLALTKKSFIVIPRREYIGNSVTLENRMEKMIDKELLKIWP